MKIAWAFEPSGISGKQLRAMDSLIKGLAGSEAEPELLHVESEVYPGMMSPFGPVLPYVNHRDIGREIERALKQAQVTVRPEHRHILDLPVVSITNSVDETLKMAARRKCDTVALFTHGKKGVDRFLLGSFAETMVHRSKLNLLLMNPAAEWSGKVGKVLFLDDFSNESKADLRRVVSLCSERRASLVVFHYPHAAYTQNFDANNPFVLRYRKAVDRRKKAIELLCRRAGVKTEVVVKGGANQVSAAAFALQKSSGADLIVVAAKMGGFGALLGGSVTRQIIRQSPVPVLVLKANDRPRRTTSPTKPARARALRASRPAFKARSEARP